MCSNYLCPDKTKKLGIKMSLYSRHWKELMERTGTSFEINPESFTLENMFAMELHKYADVIGDIVTSAVKELGIEKAGSLFFKNILKME